MYILGISGHHRNAAAALLKDGRLVAAIEEEKLLRSKNIGLLQAGGLPYMSISYCLSAVGIGIEDVSHVTYYHKPTRLLRRQLSSIAQMHSVDSREKDNLRSAALSEYCDRTRSLALLKRLLNEDAKVVPVDHQFSHAASSFYLSGFDRSAILNLNGRGDYVSIASGIGEGRKIRIQHRIGYPNSLGLVYSLITRYLGFDSPGGEHNTQWLSLTGDPEFEHPFRELIAIDAAGYPVVDPSFFTDLASGPDPLSEKFYRSFGDILRRKDPRFIDEVKVAGWIQLIHNAGQRPSADAVANSYRRNLARSLQQRLEEVILAVAEKVRKEHRVDSLCLAGGVAMNSLLIARLERESGYKRIFVQPASGNSGCSIGAALFQYHHQLDRGRPEPLDHSYWGPEFTDQQVKPELDNCKIAYRYFNSEEKWLDEVAGLLMKGDIVAWFQGRAEFGPRSLGARSILANPILGYAKDNLNLFVKHRENFRPFAASVPEERSEEFFHHCGRLSSFLLTVSRIREEFRQKIPAAWFAIGLSRVHTVSRKTNPHFWRLLTRFGEKSGVPVLLNTSFNLFGEPIVCTPREAVRSFYCSGIDALVINRFLVRK